MKLKILLSLISLTALLLPASHAATSKETQTSLSPEEVLQELMDGNKRFQKGYLTQRDYLAEAETTANGQYPIAAIVSCLDSRVPVEIVFDQGIGDIFVGRVAGNVEDGDMLGSLEFATAVAGSKVIMVLGHEACGAVKGAIADVELGNLTQLLEKVQPAIDASREVNGPHTTDNPEYVDSVIKANVRQTLNDIRERSEVIADLEKEGKVLLVGAYYSLADGAVSLLSD